MNLATAVVSSKAGHTPIVKSTRGPQARRFDLASVTKLLTAYAVLIAVEEETVSIDDPVGPPGATLAHLLSHAAGLNLAGEVVAAPAKRRIYSNRGIELAAEHVQQAAGIDFADYVGEAVFEPLGMSATSIDGSPAHAGTSTCADLAQFTAELLCPQLLHSTSMEQATRVTFAGLNGVLPGFGRHEPNDWGLGFELRSHKSPHWTGSLNSPSTFGHFGQSGTFLWVDPETACALVMLTDRPFGAWAKAAWPALSDSILEAHYGPAEH